MAGKIFELCLEVSQSENEKAESLENKFTALFNFFRKTNLIEVAILNDDISYGEIFHLYLSKPDRKRSDFQQCIKSLEDLKNQLELSH